MTTATHLDYAAYLLDRADQYPDDSPCHVALADEAANIARGEVTKAKHAGELDASLYARLKRMSGS